jgi:hypothetical protein
MFFFSQAEDAAEGGEEGRGEGRQGCGRQEGEENHFRKED